MSARRRALLGGLVAVPALALVSGTASAAAGPDARLVTLAADLRKAEGEHNALVALEDDNRRDDERAALDEVYKLQLSSADLVWAGTRELREEFAYMLSEAANSELEPPPFARVKGAAARPDWSAVRRVLGR